MKFNLELEVINVDELLSYFENMGCMEIDTNNTELIGDHIADEFSNTNEMYCIVNKINYIENSDKIEKARKLCLSNINEYWNKRTTYHLHSLERIEIKSMPLFYGDFNLCYTTIDCVIPALDLVVISDDVNNIRTLKLSDLDFYLLDEIYNKIGRDSFFECEFGDKEGGYFHKLCK
jgi:hypothetical protein